VLNKSLVYAFLLLLFVSFSGHGQSTDNYEKALQTYNTEEFSEAFIHIKNALQDNPSHLASRMLLGKILVKLGNTDVAIEELNRALDAGADVNLVYLPLAAAYYQDKDYQQLIDLSTDKLDPTNKFEVMFLQAKSHQVRAEFSKALAKFNETLVLRPNNTRSLKAIAAFYMQRNELTMVEEYIAKLESIAAQDADLFHIKGQLLQQQGRQAEALQLFEKAYSLSPENMAISRSLANLYVQTEAYDKGRELITKTLKIVPDEPFVLLLSARLFSMTNDDELANAAFDTLIQKLLLVPWDILEQLPELLYVSALADYMVGNYEKSKKQLQIYLSKSSNDINAIVLLSDIYIRQNSIEQALQLMEKNIAQVKNNLPIGLRLCSQYIRIERTHRCAALITQLQAIHGAQVTLDLMQVEILQSYEKYSEALTFFNTKFPELSTETLKRTAVNLYFQNGQTDRALEIVNELLVIRPDDIGYLLFKSDILLELKLYDEAWAVNQNILDNSAQSFQAQFNQAQILYLNKRYSEAQRKAEKLTGREPNSFRLRLLLANSFMGQKKFDDALEQYQISKRLTSTNTQPSEQIVRIYRIQSKLDFALRELKSLSKEHFLKPAYIQSKAEILVTKGEIENAAKEFKLLFGLWRAEHEKLLVLAQMQRKAKLYDDAEQSLLRSLEIMPEYTYSKIELARLYVVQRMVLKANEIISVLLKVEANNASVHLVAGDIALLNGELDEAQRHYLLALENNNNYQLAAIKLYQLAKNDNVGAEQFTSIMQDIVSRYPKAYFHQQLLADYWLSIGELARSKEIYLQLEHIEGLANKKSIFNNLANIYLEEDPDKALFYANKAIDLDPSVASYYDTKGWILVSQDQYQNGLTFLREAYTLESNNPTNRFHLGYTLAKLNRMVEALIELEAATQSNISFPESAQAKALAEQIR
jgi:putative PEP-CTERM system TPR-repeat lipoprotein